MFSLTLYYDVINPFTMTSLTPLLRHRQVDATMIGKLVTVEGIVIRATAVKPSLCVATYACDAV